jgi:hypothetical protein
MLNRNTSGGQGPRRPKDKGVVLFTPGNDTTSHSFTVGSRPVVVAVEGMAIGESLRVEVSADNEQWFTWRVFGQPVELNSDHTLLILCIAGWYRLVYDGPGEHSINCWWWEYVFEDAVCGYIPVVDPLGRLSIVAGDNIAVSENPDNNFTISAPFPFGPTPGLQSGDSLPTPMFGSRTAILGEPTAWFTIISGGEQYVIPGYQ